MWHRRASSAHRAPALSFLLFVAVLASCTNANYLLDPSVVQVVLVGSSDPARKDYIRVANATIAKVFKTWFYTDECLPTCTLCFKQQHSKQLHVYRGAWAEEIWYNYDNKWWCAQNRPIQVLQRLLPRMQQTNQLPEFLFVGDDDTWINPAPFIRLVKGFNANDKFFGLANPTNKFPFGGAGYFVHKSILLALLGRPPREGAREVILSSTAKHDMLAAAHYTTAITNTALPEKVLLDRIFGPDLMLKQLDELEPKEGAVGSTSGDGRMLQQPQQKEPPMWLDICLQLKLNGRWCLWHSDWVVAECINMAISVTPDIRGAEYGLSYDACTPETMQNFTTCHHVTAPHYAQLYGELLVRDAGLKAHVQASHGALELNA